MTNRLPSIDTNDDDLVDNDKVEGLKNFGVSDAFSAYPIKKSDIEPDFPSKNSASLTSTDTSTDINKSSWTKIPWDNQLSVDSGYTHDPSGSPTDITFDSAGTYRVHVSISFDSGNYRVNPGIRFAINGTRRDRTGLSGYARDASGHSEASNVLTEQITVSAGDTLTVQTYQFGNSGTCTMRSSESVLLIEKMSQSTALAGDADTVDGYHAADFLLAGGDTMTGTLTTPSIDNTDYNETVNSLGNISGTVSIDLTSGNLVECTLTGNTTFNFNNPSSNPSGNSFTLILQQDGTGGHSLTWPSSVQWDSGSAPGFSTNANDKHMVSFVSPDSGTTWIGITGPTQIA